MPTQQMPPTITIQAQIPVRLATEMEQLIEFGWFRTFDELISDALRRYLEAHRLELREQFIRDDVEWGLHGPE